MYINQVVTVGVLMNCLVLKGSSRSVRTELLMEKCAVSQSCWLITVLGNVEFLDLPVYGTPTYT